VAKKVSLRITCPCCKHIVVLDRNTGEILSTHEPATKPTTGDPFEDALHKVRDEKDGVDDKFEKSRQSALKSNEEVDGKFDEALQKAREDPDQGPIIRDIDLA